MKVKLVNYMSYFQYNGFGKMGKNFMGNLAQINWKIPHFPIANPPVSYCNVASGDFENGSNQLRPKQAKLRKVPCFF